ncbi:TPA: efflux RND transporter periplasmic adaptor subunit [Streptococcus suis]|nr:efflux RND transporter periplasmic adaptor subunit [Streptococcus suis]
MLKTKKAKIALFGGLGVVAVALVGGALIFSNMLTSSPSSEEIAMSMTYTVAKEGSIASSTLLTGAITAADEQYVYYDPSKGDLSEVLVAPGTQVEVGTPLIRYDATELQSALDTAVRGRDKIGRQIEDLRTNGQTVQTTGDAETDAAATATAQRSVDMQLADLNDSYADAQAAVDKAYTALTEATVTSTVVEVNKAVSKNSTSSQTVVHIVNQGSLQVTGSLTEYDLANIAVDQEVKLTSKVYPDKTWTGKITYISNYPSSDQAGVATTGTSGSGAKYPFKAALTSELGELKQGFSVNIEVVNTSKNILIPVSAVVPEEDKNYVWTLVDGKAKKVEVTLGNADALNQEVIAGIAAGDKVITIPTPNLEDGKEVEANEEPAY